MMEFKPNGVCGKCKKVFDDDEAAHVVCQTCLLAKYCSEKCRDDSYHGHKNSCVEVAILKRIMPIVEERFQNFTWEHSNNDSMAAMAWMANSSGRKHPPENIFETILGRFTDFKDHFYWEPAPSNPKKMWPSDYIIRRIRGAEYVWNIASQHDDEKMVKGLLEYLLDTVRYDFKDKYQAAPMAGFVFLYLGQVDNCAQFIQFRIEHGEDEDGWRKFPVKTKGDYNKNTKVNRFSQFNYENQMMKNLLVLMGIKMKVVMDLKNSIRLQEMGTKRVEKLEK